jgi:hypothetical protein
MTFEQAYALRSHILHHHSCSRCVAPAKHPLARSHFNTACSPLTARLHFATHFGRFTGPATPLLSRKSGSCEEGGIEKSFGQQQTSSLFLLQQPRPGTGPRHQGVDFNALSTTDAGKTSIIAECHDIFLALHHCPFHAVREPGRRGAIAPCAAFATSDSES